MSTIKVFSYVVKPSEKERTQIIDFLFEHLEEFGDPRADIEKSCAYALRENGKLGGFVLARYENSQVTGAVVGNQTGMKDYIPENILVYIATHTAMRGKGIGKELMQKAIEIAEGSIALHVEPDNPAKFLYEKVGFTNKYLEMRYKKC